MIQIGKKDIIWNYLATFLKIASSALLIPFILRMMPAEMVGIWSVFMTITAFSGLLDLGFNPSFTRNVTYVFSGVSTLKVDGFDVVSIDNQIVDYGLLKGLILAMRWFYLRMAIAIFLLLSTLGTYYIYSLLKTYLGNSQEVYIAWILLCIINSYNLFTLYYESLLIGKGLVKRSKQFVIIGQSVYLLVAVFLIIAGFGLVAIVSAQALSIIIIRVLSYNAFFTSDVKKRLLDVIPRSQKEVLKAIYPNAIKIGLTALGGFMVTRSAMLIGSLYLPLNEIASYGISMQLILVVAGLASIYTNTYLPKISHLRIADSRFLIKQLYLQGQVILFATYILGGIILLVLADWGLNLIGSQTHLMSPFLLLAAITVAFLENNHSIAGMILLSKNKVPFFKASLVSGSATVLLLLLLFHFTNSGLWIMIAAPGIAQGFYQNWKWPLEVINDLKITQKDVFKSFVRMIN